MANDATGEIICMACGGVCDVRTNRKKKMYIYCHKYGIIQPAKPEFQEKIKREATLYGDGKEYKGGPEQEPEPKNAPASPEIAPQIEAEPKKTSMFKRFGRAILEE